MKVQLSPTQHQEAFNRYRDQAVCGRDQKLRHRWRVPRKTRDPLKAIVPKWTKDFKQPKLILVDPDSEDLSSSICVLPPVYCPMPALTHDACMVPLPSLLVSPRAESVPIPSELLA